MKLGSFATFQKGQGLPKSAISNEGEFECIHYGQLFTEYPEVIDTIISRTDTDEANVRSIANDVLMPTSDVTPSGLAKACCIDQDDVILGGDILAIRADKKKVNGHFLARQIRQRERDVLRLVSGTTVFHLYASALEKLQVCIPAPAEQRAIADCLGSVDAWLAAAGRKLAALRDHKRGLMQQLFPQPGQSQPQLRFPEFRDSHQWKLKKLGGLGRVIRGSSPRPKGDSRYYKGPVPRLMVEDVTRDGKWVTPRVDSLTIAGAKLSRPCPAGTLAIVCSGAVGIVSFLAVDACIHDGFLALIDIDESAVLKEFLYQRLSTLRDQFELGATHSGVFTNLTTSGIKDFEIHCPGVAEQQKIAACLTALDTQITAQAAQIESLKTHKHGLMQQLFPSTPESIHAP